MFPFQNTSNTFTSSSFTFKQCTTILVHFKFCKNNFRWMNTNMHSCSVSLFTSNFVNVDDGRAKKTQEIKNQKPVDTHNTSTVSLKMSTQHSHFVFNSKKSKVKNLISKMQENPWE
uniref:Ovule protein n=1 Tax=Meloidogyne incognita TaxID=6306 RepID=A0A914M5N1_MELIC